ncbi:hypothetical protein, partial [Thermus scotoductus]|uniref:hypothetical protein n=1 Tax=Thermus scotoductus TaxID=37636 RepID=UPI001C129D00
TASSPISWRRLVASIGGEMRLNGKLIKLIAALVYRRFRTRCSGHIRNCSTHIRRYNNKIAYARYRPSFIAHTFLSSGTRNSSSKEYSSAR